MIDVSKIVAAQHPRGPELVDASFHASNPVHEDFARNAEAVVSGKSASRVLNRSRLGGHSKKVVLGEIPDEPSGVRYMVKPYHERYHLVPASEARRDPAHVKLPIQGWAEMATQGLFHAAGYGHLYQQAHVVRHPDADLLVVRLPPGVQSLDKARSWHGGSEKWEPRIGGNSAGADAARMGVMDFLTHQEDRHQGNIVGNKSSMYAVDGSNAFDYGYGLVDDATRRNIAAYDHEFSPAHYLVNSALHHFESTPQDQEKALKEWWSRRGVVRKEFGRHLEAIRDPQVREHLARNFETRASLLDRAATDFDPEWVYQKAPAHVIDDRKWRAL